MIYKNGLKFHPVQYGVVPHILLIIMQPKYVGLCWSITSTLMHPYALHSSPVCGTS